MNAKVLGILDSLVSAQERIIDCLPEGEGYALHELKRSVKEARKLYTELKEESDRIIRDKSRARKPRPPA